MCLLILTCPILKLASTLRYEVVSVGLDLYPLHCVGRWGVFPIEAGWKYLALFIQGSNIISCCNPFTANVNLTWCWYHVEIRLKKDQKPFMKTKPGRLRRFLSHIFYKKRALYLPKNKGLPLAYLIFKNLIKIDTLHIVGVVTFILFT